MSTDPDLHLVADAGPEAHDYSALADPRRVSPERFDQMLAASSAGVQPVMVPAATVLPEWAQDRGQPEPVGWLEGAYRALLVEAERDAVNRPALLDTPARAARAWRELTRGMRDPEPALTAFDAEGADEIVVVSGIPFVSLCEHHLLPFHGVAHIAYLPNGSILGLSKFARLTQHVAARLQVQERMTKQIADRLDEALDPRGLAVIVEAAHSCMVIRGVRAPGSMTTTSVMRGVMKDDPRARQELLELIRPHR